MHFNRVKSEKSGDEVNKEKGGFHFVIASDILLYVSAYPALLASINELFDKHGTVEFVMSWARRMQASHLFFDSLKEAGYNCYHHGKCIYSIYKAEPFHTPLDNYLRSLSSKT